MAERTKLLADMLQTVFGFVRETATSKAVRAEEDILTGVIKYSAGQVDDIETSNHSNRRKRIVIFGSSNGAGAGASTYSGDPSAENGWASPSTSWAGLLKSALGGSWTVINRSISGTGVALGVARFWTDVAPYKPSHVIICNHPQNDGFDWRSIFLNTVTLCRYCDLIGAIPILRGAYMHPTMTAAQYAQALSFNEQLDLLGRHRIDHLSTLDAGNGTFVGGSTYHSGDGLHPNDAGYYQMFKAIDLNIFRYGRGVPTRIRQAGAWKVDLDQTTGSGIIVRSVDLNSGALEPFSSWTARVRVKGFAGGASARAFLAVHKLSNGTDSSWRLRNSSNVLSLAAPSPATEEIVSTANVTTGNTPYDVVCRWNAATGKMALFIDGSKVGEVSVTVSNIGERANFAFGGRVDEGGPAYGYTIADLAVWNTALSDDAISDIYKGSDLPLAGLIFAADMSRKPQNSGLVPNLVRNGVMGYMGTAKWSKDVAF